MARFIPSTQTHFTKVMRKASRARKNPSAPFWPFLVGATASLAAIPLTGGLLTLPIGVVTSGYGAYYLYSAASEAAGSASASASLASATLLHPIPLVAAGAAFLGARRYSPDTSIRILGTVLGYGAGVIVVRQFTNTVADWCSEHPYLAPYAPACGSKAVQAAVDANNAQWCQEHPYQAYITPSCY